VAELNTSFGQTPQRSRRGENNALRRGQSKIHRRYTPTLCSSVPRGMASKVAARVSGHNWHRNADLIALRREGFIPYTKRNDPHYQPKPMRIHARSELCEALTALSHVMAAYCDYHYDPEKEYVFEVMAPMELLASRIGVMHTYENGRKAYDIALSALSVLEQMGYAYVDRADDPDTGQNKPMRIWLRDAFFTSRGITVEEIRKWLGEHRRWAIKHGLTESLRRKHEQHLLRMERIGISIKDKHKLRNKLRQIKRWVTSPDLAEEKQARITELDDALKRLEDERLDTLLDKQQQSLTSLAGAKARRQNSYHQAFIQWSVSGKMTPIQVIQLETALKREQPGLISSDPETYYRLLLERAGVLP